ncbi:hypothetical protein CFOL_v3_12578 [Cephalotus follicularis]|uniref:Retroviral polymerase SH3-like domain-containing protein n=1 Tax=Cephalotus follicularis TaxID=3775 RepID=A0A1Q3BM26_CEPFO|nr:hypothetical protein CFOL_v3_12578 [Cephalotus follicularis]
MTRIMLCENNLLKYFWAEATNTACYILNRTSIRSILKKTPYKLWRERKPNISHFPAFGCKCFIYNNGKDQLGKFDSKADEGIFLGYSLTSRAYRCFNKRTLLVEESMHVVFYEINDLSTHMHDSIDFHEPSENIDVESKDSYQQDLVDKTFKVVKDHPHEAIICNIRQGIVTRSSENTCNYLAFLSHIEPKTFLETEKDES